MQMFFSQVADVLIDLEDSWFHGNTCIFTLFLEMYCHRRWLESTLDTKEESPSVGLQ